MKTWKVIAVGETPGDEYDSQTWAATLVVASESAASAQALAEDDLLAMGMIALDFAVQECEPVEPPFIISRKVW